MSVLFKTSVAAALSLILGAGVLERTRLRSPLPGEIPPPSAGGEISPNPGINLNITGVNSNQTLVIQSESATFENNSPLSVSFTQLSADAVASVEFQDATIANSTGQDWTGFTFSLSGSATFESVSNVFAPPLSPGRRIQHRLAESANNSEIFRNPTQ